MRKLFGIVFLAVGLAMLATSAHSAYQSGYVAYNCPGGPQAAQVPGDALKLGEACRIQTGQMVLTDQREISAILSGILPTQNTLGTLGAQLGQAFSEPSVDMARLWFARGVPFMILGALLLVGFRGRNGGGSTGGGAGFVDAAKLFTAPAALGGRAIRRMR